MENSTKKRVSAELQIISKGPLRVEGNFVVLAPDGKQFKHENPNEVYLCVCGHSSNKPFCDGSHKKTFIK
jgi:CDGSH-type Zn-finger protein